MRPTHVNINPSFSREHYSTGFPAFDVEHHGMSKLVDVAAGAGPSQLLHSQVLSPNAEDRWVDPGGSYGCAQVIVAVFR
jgi:hypothetical protein